MNILIAEHIFNKMEDLVELVHGPIRGIRSQKMLLVKPKCSIIKFKDQRSDKTEKWLNSLDKSKLRKPRDVRDMSYKHIYYPARRLAREIWLDCKTYKEFCERCGFFQNSTIASDWDYTFSKIYNRSLKRTHGS